LKKGSWLIFEELCLTFDEERDLKIGAYKFKSTVFYLESILPLSEVVSNV